VESNWSKVNSNGTEVLNQCFDLGHDHVDPIDYAVVHIARVESIDQIEDHVWHLRHLWSAILVDGLSILISQNLIEDFDVTDGDTEVSCGLRTGRRDPCR
jgi:hypothetical protein